MVVATVVVVSPPVVSTVVDVPSPAAVVGGVVGMVSGVDVVDPSDVVVVVSGIVMVGGTGPGPVLTVVAGGSVVVVVVGATVVEV